MWRLGESTREVGAASPCGDDEPLEEDEWGESTTGAAARFAEAALTMALGEKAGALEETGEPVGDGGADDPVSTVASPDLRKAPMAPR